MENSKAIIKMQYIDEFNNETTIVRCFPGWITIADQIDVFLEYLKGAGYSIELIQKIDELLDMSTTPPIEGGACD